MSQNLMDHETDSSSGWLKQYYFIRFAVSVLWVIAAFTVAQSSMALAAILLIAYPAWDALANLLDANRNGGLGANRTQALNFAVSVVTTIAVIVALRLGLGAVLAVYGVWAILSGLLQLATALGRWKSYGAQWSMVLSGAQSALAGVFFVVFARNGGDGAVATIAGYAAFGAFYFLVSAIWLAVTDARRKTSSD